MTTVLSGPNLKLKVSGARGESFADVARREGSIAGTAVPGDATDQEVLDALGLSALSLTGVSDMYATHAAATAAVGSITEGDSVLVLADETHGGKRAVYRKESGVLVFKFVANTADDLEAALAAATGAAEVGRAGGGTVQDALDDAAAAATLFGLGTNGPSAVQFSGHNYLASDASASAVGAGTVDQPNLVGVQLYTATLAGDGSTTAFAISPGFTVDSAAYRNVLVIKATRATRAQTLLTEGTDFTVSGKGTGTVTINMTVAPTADEDLFFRLYRKESAGKAPLLNFATIGYDNANDGDGPMTVLIGAHHTDIGNPGGHNSALGGSSILFKNGCSYSAGLGLSHVFDAALAGFAAGMRHTLTGTAPSALGASNRVGSWSLGVGELCEAETSYSIAAGRRTKSRIGGDFARGNGQALDARAGMVGSHRFTLRRTITSASTTSLIPPTGTATFVMPDNSVADIRARGFMVDTTTGEFRILDLQTVAYRGAGAASTVLVGENSAGAAQITEVDKTSGLAPAAGTWEIQCFPSTGSGGFGISGRSDGSRPVLFNCDVEVELTELAAAAV